MAKKSQNRSVRTGVIVGIVTVAAGSVMFGSEIGDMVRTSVIGYPEHAAFDGTVNPVQKVPDWVALDSDDWDKTYAQLDAGDFIDIPVYDPAELKIPTSDLVWGDKDDNAIRNAKITYSVPYMGNYRLDGREHVGSHLAVDIKIPIGTPIYSIANGTVVKASTQTTGFGNHIVVRHNNFPSLENENVKEVFYSSYSHLSGLSVKEGDVVTKGQKIGVSGETGTATTPHLHFQIDNDEAPWHPFWPFTWQEVSDAGLDFFSAINEAFNADLAEQTTINPMKYVQRYSDSDVTYDSDDELTDEPEVDLEPEDLDEGSDDENVDNFDDVVESSDVEESDDIEEEVVEEPADPPVLSFVIEVEESYALGEEANFSVYLRDQYGDVYRGGFKGDVVVESKRGVVTPSNPILSYFVFKDGEVKSRFKRMEVGRDKLLVEYDGEIYESEWFEVVDLDKQMFKDLPSTSMYYESVMALVEEGVVSGYPDNTFRPNDTVSRVEALKFILEGIDESTSNGDLPFPDVSRDQWYGKYLYTALQNGVISGYPDGNFRPTNTVNAAEFYKMLLNGMGEEVDFNVKSSPFGDVRTSDWFAPYFVHAWEIGLIEESVRRVDPSEGMTRGEVALAIHRLIEISR